MSFSTNVRYLGGSMSALTKILLGRPLLGDPSTMSQKYTLLLGYTFILQSTDEPKFLGSVLDLLLISLLG